MENVAQASEQQRTPINDHTKYELIAHQNFYRFSCRGRHFPHFFYEPFSNWCVYHHLSSLIFWSNESPIEKKSAGQNNTCVGLIGQCKEGIQVNA